MSKVRVSLSDSVFMAQADPLTNLFSGDRYPMIGDNTLTFLVHESGIPSDTMTTPQFAWHDAPRSNQFMRRF